MKQITVREAMRAVADGKTVHYEALGGSMESISPTNLRFQFEEYIPYFIKETVKVALFRLACDSVGCESFTEDDLEDSDIARHYKQVSAWVEIEVKK